MAVHRSTLEPETLKCAERGFQRSTMAVHRSTLEQVFAQAQTLSSLDKIRLAERLFVSIEHEIEMLSNAETETMRVREWQATIERTAGALADDPIERPPQGDYESRDMVL